MTNADHTLEYLLAFDGRIHHLEQGYWLKFEIKRVPKTKQRPHGLAYSFTLHDPEGERIVGFDNAHGVPAKGGRFKARQAENDHWHRREGDTGVPYAFTTAEQLLLDFEKAIAAALKKRGLGRDVIGESDT